VRNALKPARRIVRDGSHQYRPNVTASSTLAPPSSHPISSKNWGCRHALMRRVRSAPAAIVSAGTACSAAAWQLVCAAILSSQKTPIELNSSAYSSMLAPTTATISNVKCASVSAGSKNGSRRFAPASGPDAGTAGVFPSTEPNSRRQLARAS
jgi:hypothetical protein